MDDENFTQDGAIREAEDLLSNKDEKPIPVSLPRSLAEKINGMIETRVWAGSVTARITGEADTLSMEDELMKLGTQFAGVKNIPLPHKHRFSLRASPEPVLNVDLSYNDVSFLGNWLVKKIIPRENTLADDSRISENLRKRASQDIEEILTASNRDKRIQAASIFLQLNSLFAGSGGRDNDALQGMFSQHLIRDVGIKKALRLGAKAPLR